jgi:hypothetical protein
LNVGGPRRIRQLECKGWPRQNPRGEFKPQSLMRTLLLCLLCVTFVFAAIKDCGPQAERRKVITHALIGLGVALFVWWFLAYQIDVFAAW